MYAICGPEHLIKFSILLHSYVSKLCVHSLIIVNISKLDFPLTHALKIINKIEKRATQQLENILHGKHLTQSCVSRSPQLSYREEFVVVRRGKIERQGSCSEGGAGFISLAWGRVRSWALQGGSGTLRNPLYMS